MYTDGSVKVDEDRCAAAFYIPSLKYTWSGRLDCITSSTVVEGVAIASALRKLKTLPPQNVVVLTDSKAALQQLYRGLPSTKFPRKSLALAKELNNKGFTVKFQWIPSHIGITGNEKADALAYAALYQPPKVKVPKSNQVKKSDIRNHFGSLWVPPHMPCVTKRFHREEASLLYRIRTGSASTPAWLFKTGRINSPNCTACDETGDIEHFLWSCPRFQDERNALMENLQKKDLPHACLQHLIFPEGSVIIRKETSRLLMEFLRETGLMDIW